MLILAFSPKHHRGASVAVVLAITSIVYDELVPGKVTAEIITAALIQPNPTGKMSQMIRQVVNMPVYLNHFI